MIEAFEKADIGAIDSSCDIPFPFDHFFFCFLPPDVAAGAYDEMSATNEMPAEPTEIHRTAYHVDDGGDLVTAMFAMR